MVAFQSSRSILIVAVCAGLFATAGCSGSGSSGAKVEQAPEPKQLLHVASIKASDAGNGEGALQHLIAAPGGPDVFFETKAPFPLTFTLDLDPAETQGVRTYALVTGNHGDNGADSILRMPRGWVFSGSDDGTRWVVLDRQTAATPWRPSEERRFSLSSPARYKHFQLELTESPVQPIVRIYGVRLYSN